MDNDELMKELMICENGRTCMESAEEADARIQRRRRIAMKAKRASEAAMQVTERDRRDRLLKERRQHLFVEDIDEETDDMSYLPPEIP